MPGSKNILKKLDYDILKIVKAEFLPPQFDGDVMFVLLPIGPRVVHSKARSMEGMNKRYDGHVWTKIVTTNISNNLKLGFRSSTCISHIHCENPYCEYFQRAHQSSSFNDIEVEGFTNKPFVVGGSPPLGSTLVCKICKEPPRCVETCEAKIIYIHGDESMQRAYIHLGHHRHPVKISDYYCIRKKIVELIEEHVERTPQAPFSKIVMEASKDLLSEYLFHNEDDPGRMLSVEELEPVFDSYKELNSPSLINKVTTFKCLRRFGVMDGITKLRKLSNWAYVQRNMLPGQSNESDKVCIFKMFEIGPGSGVDLMRQM